MESIIYSAKRSVVKVSSKGTVGAVAIGVLTAKLRTSLTATAVFKKALYSTAASRRIAMKVKPGASRAFFAGFPLAKQRFTTGIQPAYGAGVSVEPRHTAVLTAGL